jgi:3-deoxy-D-manno-octulosonate 8-phosphate phosphatase (KDO 8-P phosphatase)
LLRDAGVKVVWVSGRYSEATTLCAEEIGIDELYQDNGARKLPAFQLILERYGIRIENTAFMGDDLPDIPLLMRVGLPVTVPNATRDVAEVAEYVTETAGGQGAVREFCETLLRVRGAWHTAVTRYLAARDDVILESTNAFSIS